MAIGPGTYDDLCTLMREAADADAAIVIVLGGNCGSGFSVQALAGHVEQALARIPEILRAVAEQIEVDRSHHEARN